MGVLVELNDFDGLDELVELKELGELDEFADLNEFYRLVEQVELNVLGEVGQGKDQAGIGCIGKIYKLGEFDLLD